jgi:heme exporter protein D
MPTEVTTARAEEKLNSILCGSILAFALAGLLLGASTAWVAIVLSATSMVLVLLVLRGERRRNAALHEVIDRLRRENGVAASFQDR